MVKKLLTSIKYRLVTDALDEFVSLIPSSIHDKLFSLKGYMRNAVCIPVPLHEDRLRERGFNQALLFARFFSTLLQFPLYDDVVYRVRNTNPQVKYIRDKDRFSNVRGAFALSRKSLPLFQLKEVMIVDDVWTTGATIGEMAKLLKKQGAQKVIALTLAR